MLFVLAFFGQSCSSVDRESVLFGSLLWPLPVLLPAYTVYYWWVRDGPYHKNYALFNEVQGDGSVIKCDGIVKRGNASKIVAQVHFNIWVSQEIVDNHVVVSTCSQDQSGSPVSF